LGVIGIGPIPFLDMIPNTVCLLKAASLPRDNDEFFHFCYVSASDRRVRGVSTPFQFVSDRQNEWELLDAPTMNGESVERDAVQQQEWQQVHFE